MYTFKIQGSSSIYEVIISKNGSNLIATCTCSAAQNNMACKHRLDLFLGKSNSVISDNVNEAHTIPEFICDTTEGQLFLDLIVMEAEFERLKKEIPEKKKLLSRLLPI